MKKIVLMAIVLLAGVSVSFGENCLDCLAKKRHGSAWAVHMKELNLMEKKQMKLIP